MPTLAPGMQPGSGSEFHPARESRSPLTRGFLLGHRHRTQTNAQDLPLPSFLNPHTPISRGTPSNSRRKRSTETVFLTHQDGSGKVQQENKRIRAPCCQQTLSSAPIESTHSGLLGPTSRKTGDVDSIALRVKVRQFSATARSATGACTASTSAFVPACCSHTKASSGHKSRSTSVFKPPLRLHSTNVSSPFEDKSGARSFTSNGPSRTRSHIKLPAVRPGKAKNSESTTPDTASPFFLPSSSTSLPATFDVAQANLAPGTVTCTTTYRDRVDPLLDPASSSTFLFPSFDALDDLTRWGMDAMTFLSTSPDDLGQDATNIDQNTSTNTEPNSKSSTFSNPFATPFGDDDFLENEIPFPSTRPRVVLEPMGVKKSKTLAADKARNLNSSSPGLTSNSRRRHLDPYDLSLPNRPASVPENPSTPKSPSRPPPVLPHPLPPLQSVQSPNPLNNDSLARTSSYLQRITKSSQPSSASASQGERKAAEGAVRTPSSAPNRTTSSNRESNASQTSSSTPLSSSDTESGDSKIALSANLRRKATPVFVPPTRKGSDDHLGPEDCELSVMFPQTAHYEVWDMSDHGWVSVPALLCLMVKDLRRWAATPLATPDVSLIELKCDDIPLPVRFTSLCPERKAMPINAPPSRPLSPSDSCRPNSYLTSFLGGKSALDESSLPQNGKLKKRRMSMLDAMKKHEEEQKMGKDKISLEGKWTRTFGLPGVGGCEIQRKRSGSSTHEDPSTVPARGWYLKFWIPIPTRLFLKRETRMFQIRAQIWMVDQEEERPDRFETGFEAVESDWGRGGGGGVSSLEAKTEMSVSHLRKERDMDGWWW